MEQNLEKDIATEVIAKGLDEEDISYEVDALRSVGLTVDHSELTRQILLKRHNSQGSKRKRFKDFKRRTLDTLKDMDPTIISGSFKRSKEGYPCDCGKTREEYIIQVNKLIEDSDGSISKTKVTLGDFMVYCAGCGYKAF